MSRTSVLAWQNSGIEIVLLIRVIIDKVFFLAFLLYRTIIVDDNGTGILVCVRGGRIIAFRLGLCVDINRPASLSSLFVS
jgi:hypothetical protein